MPADLHRFNIRSRRLIHRYNKLKDKNKKTYYLMLLDNDDIRATHRLKEWFYAICQSEKYTYQRAVQNSIFRKYLRITIFNMLLSNIKTSLHKFINVSIN